MARIWMHRPWRIALSAGTVCGLTLGGAVLNADPPRPPGDSFERATQRDADLDAAIQKLGVNTVKPGSSSSAIRKQAISELPLADLSASGRTRSEGILKNLAMFRRLPTLSFEVDPDIYEYFLTNPDVAVATWRAMEISRFQLKEIEPNRFAADAGDGSVGQIEILCHTPTETVIYCDGAFKSPLLPRPIVARSLMRLQTTFAKEPDGRVIGTHTGDVFVEFPSQAIETIAKVISPVSHSIADRNFKQMSLFVHLMTQAMGKHPGWIEMIGNKLDGVSPQQRRRFMEVSATSYVMAHKRMAAAQNRPFVPEEVLSPFKQITPPGAQPIPVSNRPGTATLRD